MDKDEDEHIETTEEGSHDEDESKRNKIESTKGKSKKEEEPEWRKFETMSLEEKRKYYRCEEYFVMLKDIMTWTEYFDENTYFYHSRVPKPGKQAFPFNKKLNDKVSLWKGDITTLEIDAIVNAANGSLLGGGGVDGCIHRAAGPTLVQECRLLNGCKTGNTKLTLGHKLPAKYVLHTVGPIGKHEDNLESCYETCLRLCLKHEIRTVAFCCISTGIFGYPNKDAAKVALRTTRQMLEDNTDAFDRIIFCLFLEKDIEIYHSLMMKYFPPRELEDIKKSEKIKRADKEENMDKNNEPNDVKEKASKKLRQDSDSNLKQSDTAEKQNADTEKQLSRKGENEEDRNSNLQKTTENTEDMKTPTDIQSDNSSDKETANLDMQTRLSSTEADTTEKTQMEVDKPAEEPLNKKEEMVTNV